MKDLLKDLSDHFNEGFIDLGLERMKGPYKSNDCLEPKNLT